MNAVEWSGASLESLPACSGRSLQPASKSVERLSIGKALHRNCYSRRYLAEAALEVGVERKKLMVVQDQIGLDFLRFGLMHVVDVEREAVWRQSRRVARVDADQALRQFGEELQNLRPANCLERDRAACGIDAVPWKTRLARSRPIVVICMAEDSCSGCLTAAQPDTQMPQAGAIHLICFGKPRIGISSSGKSRNCSFRQRVTTERLRNCC